MTNSRLFVSFSGGRTSAYMTIRILKEWRSRYDEIVVLFANTGKEHHETLEFVHRIETEFGIDVIWLEAVVHPERGRGTTHRIVNYETASRKGEPFENVIKKFGISNNSYPHCTRELKQRPMYSYIRDSGWKKGSFDVAVGIRDDEIDRISSSAEKENIIYPLVKWKIKKADVLQWWKGQSFDLRIPEHLGNCDFCWKKSLRKHLTIAADYPSVMDFPMRMEESYPFHGPGSHDGPRHFFRGNRSAKEILEMSRTTEFSKFVDSNYEFDNALDLSDGCEDSCEVFTEGFTSDLSRLSERENRYEDEIATLIFGDLL